jgi:hypothetical protein
METKSHSFSEFLNDSKFMQDLKELVDSGFTWINLQNFDKPEVGRSKVTELDIHIPSLIQMTMDFEN